MQSRNASGRFRTKHPANTVIDHIVMQAVASKVINQKIACKTAFRIVSDLSVQPSVIGIAIDMQEVRIMACQLGLFGYRQRKKILSESNHIEKNLKTDIHVTADEGCITCQKAWQFSKAHKISRLRMGQLCESMGIRICKCQLGAFA